MDLEKAFVNDNLLPPGTAQSAFEKEKRMLRTLLVNIRESQD